MRHPSQNRRSTPSCSSLRSGGPVYTVTVHRERNTGVHGARNAAALCPDSASPSPNQAAIRPSQKRPGPTNLTTDNVKEEVGGPTSSPGGAGGPLSTPYVVRSVVSCRTRADTLDTV